MMLQSRGSSSRQSSDTKQLFAIKKLNNRYLKNVFPGGFNLNQAKDRPEEMVSTHCDRYNDDNSLAGSRSNVKLHLSLQRMPSSSLSTAKGGVSKPTGGASLHAWSRGNFDIVSEAAFDQDANSLGMMTDTIQNDAFADLAGPFFSNKYAVGTEYTDSALSLPASLRHVVPVKEGEVDMNDAVHATEYKILPGSVALSKKNIQANTVINNINTNNSITSKSALCSKKSETVYQSPAALPSFKSRRDIKNSGLHEQWLNYSRMRQQQVQQQLYQEGLDMTRPNTTASTRSPSRQKPTAVSPIHTDTLSNKGSETNLKMIPLPLTELILVQISQFKDVVASNITSSSYKYIRIQCGIKYRQLATAIIDLHKNDNSDMYDYSDEYSASDEKKDVNTIELYHFNIHQSSWKRMYNDDDLFQSYSSLQSDSNGNSILSVMFTFSKRKDQLVAIRGGANKEGKVLEEFSRLAAPRSGMLSNTLSTGSSIHSRAINLYDDFDDELFDTKILPTTVSNGHGTDNHHSSTPHVVAIPRIHDTTNAPAASEKPKKSKQNELARILEQKLLKTKW